MSLAALASIFTTRALTLGVVGGVLEFLWNIIVSPLWVNLINY